MILDKYLTDIGRPGLLASAQRNWVVRGSDAKVDRTIVGYQPSGVVGAVLTAGPYAIDMVDFDAELYGDNAVLQLSNLSERTPAVTIARQAPDIGEHVTSIGFPSILFDPASGAIPRPSFKSGTVSSSQVKNGHRETEVNADILEGMSGGPTVNDEGVVVGVNSNGFLRSGGNFNFITDTYDLRRLLTTSDVTFPEAAGATTTSTTAVPTIPPTRTERATSTRASTPPLQSKKEFDPSTFVYIGGGIAGVFLVGMAGIRGRATARRAQQPAISRNCRTCGEMNSPHDQFCSNCGMRLD